MEVPEPAPSCDHATLEIRRRQQRSGFGFYFIRQCLQCGEAIGSQVARTKVTGNRLDFDEELLQTSRQTREAEIAELRLEWQKSREIRGTEWWEWYNNYLRSEAWREIRGRVLRRDKLICQGCGGTATQVHHLSYKHAGAEFLFELVAVCIDCHERLHAADPS